MFVCSYYFSQLELEGRAMSQSLWSVAFHSGDPGAVLAQFMWGLWWTEQQYDILPPPPPTNTQSFPCVIPPMLYTSG
jgi:hypothetical protein